MSKRTPKNPKNCTTLLLFYVDTRKKFESKKRQQISFRPPRWHVPYRNHQACCERSSGLREAYTLTCPKWDNIFYPSMLMLFHDSMPRFMNFKRVLYLLELQKQAPQRLPESHGVVLFEICRAEEGSRSRKTPRQRHEEQEGEAGSPGKALAGGSLCST